MKLLFLTQDKLENVLEKCLQVDEAVTGLYVTVSSEKDTDIVCFTSPTPIPPVTVSSVIPDLQTYYNVKIKDYSVMEVGDYGEGFVFFVA